MEAHEIQPRARHECGQALHELKRRHHDVGGAVLVRAFKLQHNIAGAVEFELFIDNGGDLAGFLKLMRHSSPAAPTTAMPVGRRSWPWRVYDYAA